jgi:mRNA-degrading endonuclease RelE of RelBE toxin-antitoxin system
MDEYQAIYEDRFVRTLARYSNLRQRIQRKVEQILEDLYDRTERLGQVSGGLDLRGCRSARVGRNFRMIFVICEECQHIQECQYCFCEGREDETVVFLTVGPHDRAYTMR